MSKAKPAIRPAIKRILDDLADPDEDIATYAGMNVLRLREVTPEEVRALVPPLRGATTHASISVRFFAKKALNAVRHQMAKYPEFRSEVEAIRAETMGTSWADLLAHLEEAATDKKLVVLDLLRDVQDPSLGPAVIDFMGRETDPFVLAEAVKICGAVGDERILPELQKFLKNRDSRVRSNAAEALEEIGGKAVIAHIVPLLDDEDNRVKGTVAKLLAKYGEVNVLHGLADMLHSVELWMRESATYALGFVPFREAEDLLFEALVDVNPEVQTKAIQSIGQLRSRRGKDLLETIVRQADTKLGELAATALSKIAKDPKDYQYFDESNRFTEAAATRPARGGKKGSKDQKPPPAAASPEAHAAEAAPGKAPGFLARIRARREEEKLKQLAGEERLLVESELAMKLTELGKLALDCWKGRELKLDLKDLENDVKKVLYLIEQKASQKQEIEEEATKSSFFSFLPDFLARFTREKQVEDRMGSLQKRLEKKYSEIAEKVLAAYKLDDVEMMPFKDLPTEITKLRKRLASLGPGPAPGPGPA